MNDERTRRWLPTWIPESLLLAEEERARRARESAGKVADRVSTVMEPVAKTYPDEASKLAKIRESIRVSPQVSSDAVLSKMGFTSEESRKLAFSGKRVLDVGGWFSGLAAMLSGYWAKVVVADPVFFEPDVEACFEKDLESMRKLVKDLQDKIAAGEGESERLKNAMNRNLEELERVHMEMFFWRWYDAKRFPSITRLPAFAENLSALPASSQDFVFATNVVGKSTLDVSKFHSELVRVLSPKGKAFILDYDDPSAATNSKELESLLRKTRVTNSFTDGWHRIVIS